MDDVMRDHVLVRVETMDTLGAMSTWTTARGVCSCGHVMPTERVIHGNVDAAMRYSIAVHREMVRWKLEVEA